MLEKKSPKGNLDKRRNTFLIIGFIVVLGLVYAGFELFAPKKKPIDLGSLQPVEIQIIEDVLATDKTPPPPPPEQPKEALINIVENTKKIEVDLSDLFGQDVSQNDKVEEYIPIEIIPEVPDKQPPVVFPEKMPEPGGGWDAMYAFLKSNLQYPEGPRTLGISGTVLVEFVVERDGTISNVKVMFGVHPELDKEAMRVVKIMPKWTPGEQMGKTVRCLYNIPIRFTIN